MTELKKFSKKITAGSIVVIILVGLFLFLNSDSSFFLRYRSKNAIRSHFLQEIPLGTKLVKAREVVKKLPFRILDDVAGGYPVPSDADYLKKGGPSIFDSKNFIRIDLGDRLTRDPFITVSVLVVFLFNVDGNLYEIYVETQGNGP